MAHPSSAASFHRLWLPPVCVSGHTGPMQRQFWHLCDAGVLLSSQGEQRIMVVSVRPTESKQMLLATLSPRPGYAFWVLTAGREPQPGLSCKEGAQGITALQVERTTRRRRSVLGEQHTIMLISKLDASPGAGAACFFVPALRPANVLSSWLQRQPAEQWMADIHRCSAARCFSPSNTWRSCRVESR